jgi:hypothetical protein
LATRNNQGVVMNRSFLFPVLLLLAACGSKNLALPEPLVDKAATCGVVAAIQAREGTADVKAALPFDAQGRILHYTLLAASQGGSFASSEAVAVNDRMGVLQKQVIAGKWQPLVNQCHAAFPEADATQVSLPADRLEAQLGCDELADFLGTTLAREDRYGNELAEYRQLGDALDRTSMPAALRARVGSDLDAQQALRRKAMAKIVRSGSPMPVMRECLSRFG